MSSPRLGQAPKPMGRNEFHLKLQRSFLDPAFNSVKPSLPKVEGVSWENFSKGLAIR